MLRRSCTVSLMITGEPDAMKVARPVRRGGVGKVLMQMSNSLASYPTACPCSKEAFQSNPVGPNCLCFAVLTKQSSTGILSYSSKFFRALFEWGRCGNTRLVFWPSRQFSKSVRLCHWAWRNPHTGFASSGKGRSTLSGVGSRESSNGSRRGVTSSGIKVSL